MSTTLQLTIELDSKGAVQNVKALDGAIGDLEKSTQKTTKTGGNFLDSMFAQVTAANLASKAIKKLTNFVGDSIAAYDEVEKINTKLNSALRANGESIEENSGRIDDFASKMQFLTGINDEQVKSLETLARAYGIQTEAIDQTIQGVIGLTELYGGDYESNLKAVAKAYDGNWSQLEKLIPELKNLGSESEKVELLQRKMADGIKSATDMMQSQQGQVTQLKNDWQNFKESAGGAITFLITGLANMNGALTMRRIAQKGMMEQMAEDDAKQKKIADDQIAMVFARNATEKQAEGIRKTINERIQEFEKKTADEKVKHDKEVEKAIQAVIDKNERYAESLGYDTYNAYLKAKTAAEAYLSILDKMPKTQDAFNQGIEYGIPPLGRFISEEEKLAEKLGITVEELREAKKRLDETVDSEEKAAESAADYQAAIGLLVNQLNKLIPGIGDAYNAISSFSRSVEDGGMTLGGFVSSAIAVVNVLQGIFGHALETAIDKQNDWMDLTTEHIAVIKDFVEALVDAEYEILKIGTAIDGMSEEFQKFASATFVGSQVVSKSYNAIHAATSQALGQMINSMEINLETFEEWAVRTHEILSDFDSGVLSSAETAAAIGDAFESLIGKAEDLGTEGSAAIIAIFEDLETRGMKVAEVEKYINEQRAAGLEGYKKMKEAMLENVDLQEIFGGINIQVYEDMLNYQNKIAANPALINAIDGATAALIGLSNTTKLTEGQYDQFEQTASSAYDKLIAQGFTSKEALQSLAPMLARLRMLHEEYGLTIDDATQKLLDEAEAQGVNTEQAMGQEEANQRIVESLERLVEIFGGALPDAIDQTSRAFDGLADSAGRVQYPDSYGGGKYDGDIPEVYAASGFYSPRLSSDTLIQAHAGEEVKITPASTFNSPRSGGDGVTVIVQQENNISFSGISGTDKDIIADKVNACLAENVRGMRDTMQTLIKEQING